jgi:hypothetical protein
MKLTIIKSDAAVYVDGYSYSGLSIPFVPDNVHALQWKGASGWIEYQDNDDGTKPANQSITALPDWATAAYNVWLSKKAESDAAQAAVVTPE